jgi:hypothetical protein
MANGDVNHTRARLGREFNNTFNVPAEWWISPAVGPFRIRFQPLHLNICTCINTPKLAKNRAANHHQARFTDKAIAPLIACEHCTLPLLCLTPSRAAANRYINARSGQYSSAAVIDYLHVKIVLRGTSFSTAKFAGFCASKVDDRQQYHIIAASTFALKTAQVCEAVQSTSGSWGPQAS